jgi:cobalt-zinc-cadmium efflux system membrane fusion protein
MKKILWIPAALIWAGCGKKAEPDAGKAVASVTASVATVGSQRFVETVDAVGTVTPRAGHVASLAAPSPTRVARVLVTVGATVKAGDPLVEFDQAAFDAAATSADAALTAAEKASERAQRLADAGVSPRKDAEAAVAELAVARANAVTARRARELSTLHSPINGVVTRMIAVLGANADAGQPLVDIADPGALDVVLTLSAADAARARAGNAVTLFAGASAGDSSVASGVIAEVAAAVDSASRGVFARVGVGASKRPLRIGESMFGRIAVAVHASVPVVPLESLVPNGEGFRVFVVDDKGIAHAREVTIGGRSDHGAWITDGVKTGERVVTTGAYGMDDSVKVITGKP